MIYIKVANKASDVRRLAEHPTMRLISSRIAGNTFSLAAPALHPTLLAGDVPALGEHTSQLRAEFET